jgi:uncharacterized protein YjiS (DUF1127 family)
MSSDIRSLGWIALSQSWELALRVALRLSYLLDRWSARRRQRAALLELSEHMLKDIGIDRGAAYREGRKPFWRG